MNIAKKRRSRPPKIYISKNQADYYFHRIIRLFKDWNLSVFLHSCDQGDAGYAMHGPHPVIQLDPGEDILPTAIHEAMHILYPELKDYMIVRLEYSIFFHLSDIQLIRLLNTLTSAINRNRCKLNILESYCK